MNRSKKETGEADSATDAALQAEKFVREFQKNTGNWLHGIRWINFCALDSFCIHSQICSWEV